MRNLPEVPRSALRALSARTSAVVGANLNGHPCRTNTVAARARTSGARTEVEDRCSFQPCARNTAETGWVITHCSDACSRHWSERRRRRGCLETTPSIDSFDGSLDGNLDGNVVFTSPEVLATAICPPRGGVETSLVGRGNFGQRISARRCFSPQWTDYRGGVRSVPPGHRAAGGPSRIVSPPVPASPARSAWRRTGWRSPAGDRCPAG